MDSQLLILEPQKNLYMKTEQKHSNFHAVEFMKTSRDELTRLYHADKESYLKKIRKSLENFKNKNRQKQRP